MREFLVRRKMRNFQVFSVYEYEYIGRFSNIYYCSFKASFFVQQEISTL